jgi:hypothetical protein
VKFAELPEPSDFLLHRRNDVPVDIFDARAFRRFLQHDVRRLSSIESKQSVQIRIRLLRVRPVRTNLGRQIGGQAGKSVDSRLQIFRHNGKLLL